MKWFRSNLRIGTRLALLSLLLQFALSFGHFHSVATQATLTARSGLADAGKVVDRGAIEPATSQQQQPSSDHDSGRPPADPCAICATIALASTVLFATPPALLLPSAHGKLAHQNTDTDFVRLNSAAAAFQPRGPPAS